MNWITDANTAVAKIAYQLSEVIAVYPITPSTSMAECCESWSSQQKANALGAVPTVIEMQSEGGSIAVVHGSAMCGALSTTFTSSQGLLLMIPTLYKLVGELTPCVIHVAARSLATHALSIFCDHSDVMAVRQTGVAMLVASNGQEAQDMALVAYLASLRCRLPFIHFFDGFITSHSLSNITPVPGTELRDLLPEEDLLAFRHRALTPDRPTLRGATAGPDSYFQCREAQNSYHWRTPEIVEEILNEFAHHTCRQYHVVEYSGHPQATRVVVAMGSSVETLQAFVEQQSRHGEQIGVINIRLYRPFPTEAFLQALPSSVQRIAVLDRTKEPGSSGEPLYLDVLQAVSQSGNSAQLCRGRYGLSGKAFYPEDAQAIFEMLNLPDENLKHEFTIGILDDITQLSLPSVTPRFLSSSLDSTAIVYGYGGDGSISACKNAITTLGEHFSWQVNAQFDYDSKKSGNITTTYLRLSPELIRAPYPLRQSGLLSVAHMKLLVERDIAAQLMPKGTLLLNTPLTGAALWNALPIGLQCKIQSDQIKVMTIDADRIAAEHELKDKPSIVMQVALIMLLGKGQWQPLVDKLKSESQVRLAGKKPSVIDNNLRCIDASVKALNVSPFEAQSQPAPDSAAMPLSISVTSLTGQLLAGKGDRIPVSQYPADGVWPTNTARLEKRNLADELPVWSPDLCTQCGYCVAICPHTAIRAKIVTAEHNSDTLKPLKSMPYRSRQHAGSQYTLQVSPDDCTGCQLCAQVCPASARNTPENKALMMVAKSDCYELEQRQFQQFEKLPSESVHLQDRIDVKTLQTVQPYFEYPNACSGCGETAYIRILTQLYGDRLYIANATGCSSIFGGNLPTTPYSQDQDQRGPAWANSLFEDNAEFGLGMKLAVQQLTQRATHLLSQELPDHQYSIQSEQIPEKRQQIETLKSQLCHDTIKHDELKLLSNYLVEKQVWLVGGDGWAYDIGFGGLDHVLRSGENINILVLDTQCYANTGGQKSKSTPEGKTAKLCSQPNTQSAKDLISMYQQVPGIFVARIALGANMNQTIKALKAAGEHTGPSLVVAYSPCIEHGYDLAHSAVVARSLVKGGGWDLLANVTQEPTLAK